MKDYKRIKHMRNLNDSLIWERMKRCYDFGYEDGKADTPFTDTEEAEKKAYDKGLSDAWDLVKRIESTPEDGGLTNKQIVEVFGQYWSSFELYRAFSVEEAMDLMKAYEDKKQDAEIKVGNEVTVYDTDGIEVAKALVLSIQGEGYGIITSNGTSTWSHKKFIKKTDKYHPQIAEVLGEMRGTENDE